MSSPLKPLLLGLALLSSALVSEKLSYAEDVSKSEGDKVGVSLEVDSVSPRMHVDHWLAGAPVEAFSKDNVYVIEFWATWCIPCVKAMPHLGELADRYAKDGLVVVAITKADEANTQEAVEDFIKKQGDNCRIRFGFCDGDEMSRAFMEAAGQNGIPCSFVIDRNGKVAYFGPPSDLDYVLERVVKGQWRGKVDADELRGLNASIGKLSELAQTDPDKAMSIVDLVRRVNPVRAKSLDFAYGETLVLCKKGFYDRAKLTIESSCGLTNKTVDWGGIAMLCGVLASSEFNPEGVHRDFAIAKMGAAEAALKDDWQSLIQVGFAYKLSGQDDKFKECMARVIALCPDEQFKGSLLKAIELR